MIDVLTIRVALAVVLAFSSGCGPDCIALAREYATEISFAQTCDPSVPDQCGAERPVVDYQQQGSQLAVDGLGSCTHSVNPARLARLDEILARYKGGGCTLLPLPFCTPVENRCYTNGEGRAVCWP